MKLYSIIVRFITDFLFNLFCHEQPKISLLIPFSSDDKVRQKSFKWLLKYWKHELPNAEIIVGKSNSDVFCKGEALNNAFKKSTGKVVVVMDSDAYISGKVIDRCADRILEEIERGYPLWYVPYRHLYRLTKEASKLVLSSDPKHPYRFPNHPPDFYIENVGDANKYGHRYGAMCTIIPREAIEKLGGFDERFKGWGGEDIALLRALDTLYGKHKTTKNSIFHIWHPVFGDTHKTRTWAKQENPGNNNALANRYNKATGNPSEMRRLVDECWKLRK